MRSLFDTLILSICLGLFVFSGIYFWQKHRIDEHHEHLTTFEWFCEEFEVTPDQRKKIEALHTAYFPECEDHCIHYADTKRTLAHITEDPGLDQAPNTSTPLVALLNWRRKPTKNSSTLSTASLPK